MPGEHVAALRRQLWQAGFQPIPVGNAKLGDKNSGKAPLAGKDWQIPATPDKPPFCVTNEARPHALNTGILCNGLRAIDFDVDDRDLLTACYQRAIDLLPPGAPLRRREDSPRCLLLYRAAEGEPHKLTLAGKLGTIEVLGKGNQFVAYGQNYQSLAELQWPEGGPDVVCRDDLPAVDEDQITAFLAACAPILDAPPPGYTNGKGGEHEGGEPEADPLRIAAALADIPNSGPADWNWWNRVCMAVWRATGGHEVGWQLLAAWSGRNPAYDPALARARWDHYRTSPPTQIGAGTIFYMAAQARGEAPPDQPADPALWDELAIEAWAARPMPEPDRLLGDVVTTTTRMFLVGRTGLGKTQLGYGIARGVSAGDGFLHWRSSRPARVLLIDGEMPAELIKARSIDAIRRAGSPPPEALAIFSRDTEEAFAKQFPSLGLMQPLNTEAGHNFVLALIGALGGIDLVIFDNVMSLLVGDHREETTWAGTLPLVERLTTRRIGQLWLDHTGHNTDRQYGSSTKGWRFDAIGVMSELPEDQRAPRELAITLSFEWPGKARRRTPENWQDFEPHIIRLTDDVWTSEAVKPAPPPDGSDELRGQTRQAFLVLQNRIAEIGQRGIAGVPMAFLSIAENEWREAFYANAMPGAENDAKQKAFRRAADQLVQRSMAAIYNRRVWLCK